MSLFGEDSSRSIFYICKKTVQKSPCYRRITCGGNFVYLLALGVSISSGIYSLSDYAVIGMLILFVACSLLFLSMLSSLLFLACPGMLTAAPCMLTAVPGMLHFCSLACSLLFLAFSLLFLSMLSSLLFLACPGMLTAVPCMLTADPGMLHFCSLACSLVFRAYSFLLQTCSTRWLLFLACLLLLQINRKF